METVTFTPLSRGRYRYNQGPSRKPIILKQGQLEGFRAVRLDAARRKAQAARPPQKHVWDVSLSRSDFCFVCPACQRVNNYYSIEGGMIRCRHCSSEIHVFRRRGASI